MGMKSSNGMTRMIAGDDVIACGVTKDGIGKPLKRFVLVPDEKAVMAQWAVGRFVASWGEQFEMFRKNPGPHNEPPNN
jgi:hypothetical protein